MDAPERRARGWVHAKSSTKIAPAIFKSSAKHPRKNMRATAGHSSRLTLSPSWPPVVRMTRNARNSPPSIGVDSKCTSIRSGSVNQTDPFVCEDATVSTNLELQIYPVDVRGPCLTQRVCGHHRFWRQESSSQCWQWFFVEFVSSITLSTNCRLWGRCRKKIVCSA